MNQLSSISLCASFFFQLLLAPMGQAQTNKIDSLLYLADQAEDSNPKVELFIEVAKAYYPKHLEKQHLWEKCLEVGA